jgi:hypothetical protein
MPSSMLNALRRHPALSRPRKPRVRKPVERPVTPPAEPKPRAARVPRVLTVASRRFARETLPEAFVPYLRLSGRWLEERGFLIGQGVQVIAEEGRVTLVSEGAAKAAQLARTDHASGMVERDLFRTLHEQDAAQAATRRR